MSLVIHRWRKEFQERGPEIFADKRDHEARRAAQGYEPGESPDDLKKLIGELTVQNDILKRDMLLRSTTADEQGYTWRERSQRVKADAAHETFW